MKSSFAAVVALSVVACGTDSSRSEVVEPMATGDQELARCRAPDKCRQNGQFDFQLQGTGFTAYEGKTVFVAAMQSRALSSINLRRVVLLRGTISQGAFSLACADSLTENYAYPSWAAFIDVDGDGYCTNADVGFEMKLYGWAYDVRESVVSSGFESIGAHHGHSGPMGVGNKGLCGGYFFGL